MAGLSRVVEDIVSGYNNTNVNPSGPYRGMTQAAYNKLNAAQKEAMSSPDGTMWNNPNYVVPAMDKWMEAYENLKQLPPGSKIAVDFDETIGSSNLQPEVLASKAKWGYDNSRTRKEGEPLRGSKYAIQQGWTGPQTPVPFAREVLQEAKRRGIGLTVLTGREDWSTPFTQQQLKDFGIDADEVLSVGSGKKKAEILKNGGYNYTIGDDKRDHIPEIPGTMIPRFRLY